LSSLVGHGQSLTILRQSAAGSPMGFVSHPDIARARSKSITTFIQHMQTKHVPPDIIEAITEISSAIFENHQPKLDYTIPVIKTAFEHQEMIGFELLTRGFLLKQWLSAILYFTHNPDQKLKSILLGLWLHVMEPMWEARNEILHKDTSIVHINAHKQLDSELQDRKTLSRQRLHHTQQHLTSYSTSDFKRWTIQHKYNSTSDFKRWTIQHKYNTLHILQLAHRNYKQYLDSEDSNNYKN
jgi:hypothetical protein